MRVGLAAICCIFRPAGWRLLIYHDSTFEIVLAPVLWPLAGDFSTLSVSGTQTKSAAEAAHSLTQDGSVFILIDDLIGLNPRHHLTQLGTHFFNWMCRIITPVGRH